MALTGELGKELPCASAAQPRGHRDRVAAGGLLGLQDLLPSHGSGFVRMMLFGLFPGCIPHVWKIEIAICSHDNAAGECCCSLLAVPGTQGSF